MHHAHPDTLVLLGATIAADLIVGGGWLFLAFAILWALRSFAARRRAEAPDVEEDFGVPVRLVFAGLSFLFWPAGVALCAVFLGKPATARTGLWCGYALVLNLTFAVIAAVAIVTAVAVWLPELLVP